MNIDANKVVDCLLEQIKEQAKVIAILQAQLSELKEKLDTPTESVE